MKLKKYESYDHYVKNQRETDERKTKKSAFKTVEVEKLRFLIDHYNIKPKKIMCHGARYGVEIFAFRAAYSKARVTGTDLFLKGNPCIIEWDFQDQKKEWINQFDVIYSNALDHACYPEQCIKVWLEQLSSNGILIIQWSTGNKKIKRGDCFSGTLDEFIDFFNCFGIVKDIVYICKSRKGFIVDVAICNTT